MKKELILVFCILQLAMPYTLSLFLSKTMINIILATTTAGVADIPGYQDGSTYVTYATYFNNIEGELKSTKLY
jgi:hypothetical protein